MALSQFGKCFNPTYHKEVEPYNVYNYENISMGACSIESALDILKDVDKQQLFVRQCQTCGCSMDNQMFGLTNYSYMYCQMYCKVIMDG